MTDRLRAGRAPSMADVAARAGVSPQTVSRVLRGHRYVADGTRQQVLNAADSLGYRMHAAARALSSGRSRLLGLVLVATDSYASAATHTLVEHAARERGYGVTVTQTPGLSLADVLAAIDRLEEHGAEALVLALPLRRSDPRLEAVAGRLPTAVLGGCPIRTAHRFAVDQELVARLVTEHLLDLGHRTVHHVAGPTEWSDAAAREQGWCDTLARHRRVVPEALRGDWSARSGHRLGLDLFEDPDVTAVFAANDDTALGLVRALHDRGRDVPGDVSIASVDDMPLAAYSTPRLTTVSQPFPALTAAAVGSLIALLEGDDPTDPDPVLTPALVVRGSTAPPRPTVVRTSLPPEESTFDDTGL